MNGTVPDICSGLMAKGTHWHLLTMYWDSSTNHIKIGQQQYFVSCATIIGIKFSSPPISRSYCTVQMVQFPV